MVEPADVLKSIELVVFAACLELLASVAANNVEAQELPPGPMRDLAPRVTVRVLDPPLYDRGFKACQAQVWPENAREVKKA